MDKIKGLWHIHQLFKLEEIFCLLTELSWSYSRKFSHHNNGYKMCLNVCAGGEGDGEGTHLSIFLYLMKGPHDDNLKWPLRVNTLASLLVKLLNQISDNLYLSKEFDL